jgi:hypothetical protein
LYWHLYCAAGDFFPAKKELRAAATAAASASCWLLAAASASAWRARERTKIATLCWQEVIKTSHALKGAPASTSWLVVGFVL